MRELVQTWSFWVSQWCGENPPLVRKPGRIPAFFWNLVNLSQFDQLVNYELEPDFTTQNSILQATMVQPMRISTSVPSLASCKFIYNACHDSPMAAGENQWDQRGTRYLRWKIPREKIDIPTQGDPAMYPRKPCSEVDLGTDQWGSGSTYSQWCRPLVLTWYITDYHKESQFWVHTIWDRPRPDFSSIGLMSETWNTRAVCRDELPLEGLTTNHEFWSAPESLSRPIDMLFSRWTQWNFRGPWFQSAIINRIVFPASAARYSLKWPVFSIPAPFFEGVAILQIRSNMMFRARRWIPLFPLNKCYPPFVALNNTPD